MVGWHHQLDGHEFEQALGVDDRQGSLACCSPWGRKVSEGTEWLNWTECDNLKFCTIWKDAMVFLTKKCIILWKTLDRIKLVSYLKVKHCGNQRELWGFCFILNKIKNDMELTILYCLEASDLSWWHSTGEDHRMEQPAGNWGHEGLLCICPPN